jgi:hypothetical protein
MLLRNHAFKMASMLGNKSTKHKKHVTSEIKHGPNRYIP